MAREKTARVAFERTGAVTLIVFAVLFLAGALIGWAVPDENAWAAWRIGLIIGAVGGSVAFLIGLIVSAFYIMDNDIW